MLQDQLITEKQEKNELSNIIRVKENERNGNTGSAVSSSKCVNENSYAMEIINLNREITKLRSENESLVKQYEIGVQRVSENMEREFIQQVNNIFSI